MITTQMYNKVLQQITEVDERPTLYYVWLTKGWWEWAKVQGYLKGNRKRKRGIKYIKVKRIGLLARLSLHWLAKLKPKGEL